jgi:glycosyltransferase involved in cell wall biosynthesis
VTTPTIFHLDDARTWRGGQQQVLYLHQGLLALGHDSRVICRRDSAFHERLTAEQLPHYAMPIAGGHDVFAGRRIAGLVRADQGLLHAHTSHAHDLGLWASRLGGVRRFVVSRRVDFAVGRGLLGRRKYQSARVRRYLAISSAVERELVAAGVESARIARVPSGVDFTRFDGIEADWRWRESFGLAPGELLFGSVAALAPHKDQATLLRAFARFLEQGPSAQLVILGEGELRGELEALRAELGLVGRVHLPGFTDAVLPKLAAMDIFVLSSNEEGLGTSLLDAMALARPIVATAAGGIVDAVRDGQNGRLVPIADAPSFASAMRALQADAELRRRFGRNGQTIVREFDVLHTVEKTLEVYRAVAEEVAP